MRLVYPLLWSRLGRQACREQSVNTAAALARRGVEVSLLMPRRAGDPDLTAEDMRAYFDVRGDFRLVRRDGPAVSEALLPSLAWMRRAFADPEVRASDVFYSRIPVSLVLGGGAPIPFAADQYRPWPDDWPWLRPLIARSSSRPHCLGLVIHSDFAAGSYRRAGVPPEKLLVAHNGADPRRMLPRLDKAAARAALKLPVDRSIAVYAGRINARKGLDQLLALASLRPDTLFLLVGSEGEGPVEAAARALANVQVLPWQAPAALPAYLYAADLLLIPAARAPLERFRHCVLPMKLFQYLAAGRPILAPFSADTAELLRDGENAMLVPPDAPESAAAALDRLLGDASLAERLGAASERLSTRLSWDHRAEKIDGFLRARLDAVRAENAGSRRTRA